MPDQFQIHANTGGTSSILERRQASRVFEQAESANQDEIEER